MAWLYQIFKSKELPCLGLLTQVLDSNTFPFQKQIVEMTSDSSPSGNTEFGQRDRANSEDEIHNLVASFERNRPGTKHQRHDVVFRNLTVQGAGMGVS